MYNTKIIKKYRPSLTEPQITHIITLCKYNCNDKDSVSIIRTLAPFLSKIENRAMKASFTTSPKLDTMDMIGEEKEDNRLAKGSTNDSDSPSHSSLSHDDLLAYNLKCYNHYKIAAAVDRLEDITLHQIDAAREHMYMADLMSLEEELAYEKELSEAASL